jgi:uncharacterized protein YceK
MRHLIMAILLTGCSALTSFIPGMGGGTNVAANTQVGKENNQTGVVVGEVKTNKIEANDIGKLTQSEQAVEAKDSEINIQNIPPWVMILMLLGWLLPSPGEIYTGLKKEMGSFFGLFRRKRTRK